MKRVPSLVEHMIDPLKRLLVDVNNYVREAAALGCAKLFHFAPEVVKGSSFLTFYSIFNRYKSSAVYFLEFPLIKSSFVFPFLISDGAIIDKLYELIRDTDSMVVVNAIRALEEILAV